MDSDSVLSSTGSNSPAGEGRIPRALREEEWQAAQPFITPELKAKFTLKDGSIDYKGMSKLIPLQVDTGPLDVVYEDDDLIAVHVTLACAQQGR
jgi:23S rRNA-/tRNA-specific pseudouridylate synthase